MERRHCSVFSILVGQLRVMGPADAGVTNLRRTLPSCYPLLLSLLWVTSFRPHRGTGITSNSWSGATFSFFHFYGATSLRVGRFRSGRSLALYSLLQDLLPYWAA